jgi:hypothetical protein
VSSPEPALAPTKPLDLDVSPPRVAEAAPGIMPPIPGMVRQNPEARFEDDLNTMLLQFRNQAIQSWAFAEADLRSKYKSLMDADELAAQARLDTSEALVAELRRKNDALERALEDKRQQGKRILFLASRVRADEHSRHLLDRVFQQWSYFMDISQSDKVKSRMASAWRMRRLVGSTFSFWRMKMAIQANERALASLRADTQAETTQLIAMSELERKREVDEIARLNRDLAEEASSKRRLQEDLKSVFMRGVCTLNFEAMQLLSGVPAGLPNLDNEIGASVPPAEADDVPPPAAAEPEAEIPLWTREKVDEPAAAVPAAEAEEPTRTIETPEKKTEKEEAPKSAPKVVKDLTVPAETKERQPRVVDASRAVRWQSAAGASIPVMSVIRPDRTRPKN